MNDDDIRQLNHIEVETMLVQEIRNKINWAIEEYDFSNVQILGILEFVKNDVFESIT